MHNIEASNEETGTSTLSPDVDLQYNLTVNQVDKDSKDITHLIDPIPQNLTKPHPPLQPLLELDAAYSGLDELHISEDEENGDVDFMISREYSCLLLAEKY